MMHATDNVLIDEISQGVNQKQESQRNTSDSKDFRISIGSKCFRISTRNGISNANLVSFKRNMLK